jgi:hypothetical protein
MSEALAAAGWLGLNGGKIEPYWTMDALRI